MKLGTYTSRSLIDWKQYDIILNAYDHSTNHELCSVMYNNINYKSITVLLPHSGGWPIVSPPLRASGGYDP